MSLESWLDESTELLPTSSLESIAMRATEIQPLSRNQAKRAIIEWIDEEVGADTRIDCLKDELRVAWKKRIKRIEQDLASAENILRGI